MPRSDEQGTSRSWEKEGDTEEFNQFSGWSSQLQWQVREAPPWCTVSLGTQQISNFTSEKSPLKQGSPTLTHLPTSAWEDAGLGDLPCLPAVRCYLPSLIYVRISFFNYYYYLIIHLAVLGLSWGTWDLQSSLRHSGSLVAACGI